MAAGVDGILSNVGAVLAALSALATASFGVLDSTKAFWGGVSNIGLEHLRNALKPFSPALRAAVGDGWWDIVRANWVSGRPKADQKSVVGALLKLGLSGDTAEALAISARVDPQKLAIVAEKLGAGRELTDEDLNLLGRMTASVEAVLDAAFERADQQYRNLSRLLAGLVALALSAVVQIVWSINSPGDAPGLGLALLVGLLAVPVAPVAKDLTSALSAAMKAIKAARAV